MANNEAAVTEREGLVAIGNALVEVMFDLKAGEYGIVDRRDSRARIAAARFHLADTAGAVLAGADSPRYTASSREVNGPLGKGKRLTITGATAGGPDLLLEIELYEDRSFVVLNAGIENKGGKPTIRFDGRRIVLGH
jgi:hypothetical protein